MIASFAIVCYGLFMTLNSLIKVAYNKIYKNSSQCSIGELPAVKETDEFFLHYFLWAHIRLARSEGKSLPLKPRKKLKLEQYAELKRNLEHIAHQCRYALAYLEKL